MLLQVTRRLSTLDPKVPLHFAKMDWRAPNNPLIGFTNLRMAYLRRELMLSGTTPLKGWKILDVGCGGGLVAERLAKWGGDVLGVDPTPEAIAAANRYKDEQLGSIPGTLEYKIGLAEEVSGEFNLIVASEVIEHTSDPQAFLKHLGKLMKPKGFLMLTAPNRTPETYLTLILGNPHSAAETLLNVIDHGTHQYEKLLTPSEVTDMATNAGLTILNTQGTLVAPYNLHWSFVNCTRLGYLMMMRK